MNIPGNPLQSAHVPRHFALTPLIFFLFGLALRWLVAGSVYLLPNTGHTVHVLSWIALAIAIPIAARAAARTISLLAIAAFLIGLVALTPVLQLLLWHHLIVASYGYPIFYWPLAVSILTLFFLEEHRGDA